MADEKADLDASEPATAFKLDKAHERGSTFRSAELTFAVLLLTCVACVYGLGVQVVDGIGLMLSRALRFASRDDLTQTAALTYGESMVAHVVVVLAPVMFAVWVSAVLCAALQARGVFSGQPLEPDLTRLNPANGFKRIFSIKSLHDLWRSGSKLGVIVLAMASWGWHHVDDVLQLAFLNPRSMQRTGLALLGSALTMLAGLVLAFALLDWSFNRWDFMRQMRMSKREIKDEHKEREGDPRIKRRRRELRVEWLRRARQLAKIRSADVLVTNPTHYAVALEYRHGTMPAPMISARGAGEMALRMRVEARRRAVPVVENPQLARELFALRESQLFVPEEHFAEVARILRWVFAARAQHRSGSAAG